MECIKCGETKESEFYPSSLKVYDYRCKRCVCEYSRKWREPHKEHFRNYMRMHPGENRENFKRWYANNRERHYEMRKRYAQANPQRHKA
ncbi:hypothetical protein LCGC14_2409310, partial [marine sediment metagenome]